VAGASREHINARPALGCEWFTPDRDKRSVIPVLFHHEGALWFHHEGALWGFGRHRCLVGIMAA
jgi:hypothetical protein